MIFLRIFLVLAVRDYMRVDFAEMPAQSWLALLWRGARTLGADSALCYSAVSQAAGTTAGGFMVVILGRLMEGLADQFTPAKNLAFN